MRFRVDCRLIDMSQDRKNQRDQTQPRYTQELDRSYFMRLTLNHLKDTILSSQIGTRFM